MRRAFVILCFLLVTFKYGCAQHTEFGVVWSPMQLTRMDFDKAFIILDNHLAYQVDKSVFAFPPGGFSISNTGVFLRYTGQRFYVQTELSYNAKFFLFARKKVESSWGDHIVNHHFRYCSPDLALFAGIRFNKERVMKFRFFAGVESELYKFQSRNYFSLINEFLTKKDSVSGELVGRMKPFTLYILAGTSVDFFATSFQLRLEHSLTSLTQDYETYNANFNSAWILRLAVNYKIKIRKGSKHTK